MDYKTLLIIAGIVGLVIALITLTTKKSKKSIKATKVFGILGMILLVVGILPVLGVVDYGSKQVQFNLETQSIGGETGGVITQTPSSSGACLPGQGVEDTTVTFLGLDTFTGSASGGTHRYKINGGPAQTVSDQGTDTLSPGDTLQILWMNASTTGSYIPDVSTVTIPCKGTFDIVKNLYQNGTLTLSVYNQEGNLIDGSTTENLSLSSDESADVKLEVQMQSKRGLPHGGVFILEANETAIDVTKTTITLNGVLLQKVDVPGVHTLNATSNKAVAFAVGPFVDNNLLTGSIHLEAKSVVQNNEHNEPKLTFRPNSYYIDETQAGAFAGPSVSDEDDTATYSNIASFVIHTDSS